MSKLYAGAGKVTIDPPKEYYPFPTNFGMTEESRNPCHVRALALDNTEKKILFVVFEMSDIPSHPDLMKRLSEASGYKEEEIIVAVTHNHSAPNDRSKMVKGADDKFAFFKEYAVTQACTAVRQAVSSMRKAKIGYGEIQSYCNVNRDKKTAYGFWVEGPAYDLYSNHTLAVVKITDEHDQMIAAMLNFGAHAVCAFCEKDADGKIKSSSNFPGIACEFVENHYGNDAVCIWTSGAAGNQDPLLFEYQYKEYEDGYVTRLDYPDGTGYLNMDILGTQQGADAVQCLESIVTAEEDEIALITSSVQIPARMKDPSFKIPPFGLRMGGRGERKPGDLPVMPELPKMVPDPDRMLDVAVQGIRLGHIGILLTSAEIYAEIGRDMMKASGLDNVFVITHIPGDGGYTLDKGSADHLVFQSFGAVEPGSMDEPLAEKARELSQKLFKN